MLSSRQTDIMSVQEGEPQPKGFRVKVESPDLLFKALERGVSGEIGRHLLESPIDEVSAELKPGKDTFNLQGEVSIDSKTQYTQRVSEEAVRRAVVQ